MEQVLVREWIHLEGNMWGINDCHFFIIKAIHIGFEKVTEHHFACRSYDAQFTNLAIQELQLCFPEYFPPS